MRFALALSFILTLSLGLADAQKIDRVVPQVVSPGDLVLLEGTGLGSTTAVDFSAFVGGFVGFLNKQATPLSVTPTLVAVICPAFNAFVPPGAAQAGSPFGAVSVQPSDQDGLDIYFTEGTGGAVATVGIGSSLPGGGRPVISFDLKGGEPVSPNAGFVLQLQRALPASPAFFAVGAPATPPFSLFGDGTITIDTAGPILFFAGFTTDAKGEVATNVPILAGLTARAGLQWIVLDTATLGLAITNGLEIDF